MPFQVGRPFGIHPTCEAEQVWNWGNALMTLEFSGRPHDAIGEVYEHRRLHKANPSAGLFTMYMTVLPNASHS